MNLHFALWAQQILAHTFVELCRPNMGSLMTAECRKGNLSPNNLSHTRVFQQTQPHFKVGGRQPRDLRSFFRSQIHHFKLNVLLLIFGPKYLRCLDVWASIPSKFLSMSWPHSPASRLFASRSVRSGRENLSRSASAWRKGKCLQNPRKKHTDSP